MPYDQISWAPTVASLDAALATAAIGDALIGQPIRDGIATSGADYDTVFTDKVSAAKVAYLAYASPSPSSPAYANLASLFARADAICRKLIPTPPVVPPLVFDATSSAAILARIDATKARADVSVAAKGILDLYRADLVSFYQQWFSTQKQVTDAASAYAGPVRFPLYRNNGISQYVAGYYSGSILALEANLNAQLASAAAWLAAIAP